MDGWMDGWMDGTVLGLMDFFKRGTEIAVTVSTGRSDIRGHLASLDPHPMAWLF